MTISNLNNILSFAEEKKFAVAAFNFSDLTFAQAMIDAATEARAPLILMISEYHYQYTNLKALSQAALYLAKNSPFPVALHLDHGETEDAINQAIDAHFTSVMFDGSSLTLDENMCLTKKYVAMAKKHNISVEGEVGKIGGNEGDFKANVENIKDFYSDPKECEDYVRQTAVDALAVAIGNAHGYYPFPPQLDYERIKEIKSRCQIPLVLHGGSGLDEESFRKSIHCGIRKINIFSDISSKSIALIHHNLNIKEITDFAQIQEIIYHKVKKEAFYYINLFGGFHQL